MRITPETAEIVVILSVILLIGCVIQVTAYFFAKDKFIDDFAKLEVDCRLRYGAFGIVEYNETGKSYNCINKMVNITW